jgi:hemerythrin-like domain-containing protein
MTLLGYGGIVMNSIEILKEDHQEALDLIALLEAADIEVGTEPTDTENFNRLNELMKLHSQIEEELFYPAMEEIEETRNIVERFYDEHKRLDQLLAQLSTKAPGEEEFQDLLVEFRSFLEIHIEEEEEELFPKAEENLGQSRLNEMGRQILEIINSSHKAGAAIKRR